MVTDRTDGRLMSGPSIFRLMLQADPILAQSAAFLFGTDDRRLIDEQIRTGQDYVTRALILGVKASYFRLDASSLPGSTGDVVCTAGTTTRTVTRALSAPMSAARSALGIMLHGAPPGSNVLVAMRGTVPPSICGVVGTSSIATVNTATARAQASGGPYTLGSFDAVGNLTLRPRPAMPSPSGGSVSGLSFSVVDVATGYGQNIGSIAAGFATGSGSWAPGGVGFAVTQSGHKLLGARYFWSDNHPIKVDLWDDSGANVATVSGTGPGSVSPIATLLFASPPTLVVGKHYALTIVDLGVAGPVFNYYRYGAGGAQGGVHPLQNMSSFMLTCGGASTTNSAPWGPYCVGANYNSVGGSSKINNIYCLGAGSNGFPYTSGAPNAASIEGIPIEPILV